jgi:hypothetical protein
MEEGKIMEFDEVHWDMYKAMKEPGISCDPRKGVSFDAGRE